MFLGPIPRDRLHLFGFTNNWQSKVHKHRDKIKKIPETENGKQGFFYESSKG